MSWRFLAVKREKIRFSMTMSLNKNFRTLSLSESLSSYAEGTVHLIKDDSPALWHHDRSVAQYDAALKRSGMNFM